MVRLRHGQEEHRALECGEEGIEGAGTGCPGRPRLEVKAEERPFREEGHALTRLLG